MGASTEREATMVRIFSSIAKKSETETQ